MVKRVARHFFRYLWLGIATLVIVYALLVAAGREFLPVINRYQADISHYLSQQTGIDVEIAGLKGIWEGASPLVGLGTVVVAGKGGGEPAVVIDELSAKPNIYQSVTTRSPVWQGLTAGHIRLLFIEDAGGHWTLGGHPIGLGNGGAKLDYLYRMLFYSRLLRIDQLQVDVRFYSGADAQFFAHDVQIENADDFHRATASLALSPSGGEAAALILEGRGDPAEPATFTGKGYLHLDRLNVAGSLHSLLAGWFPDQAEKIGEAAMDLDLDLWFDWQQNALVNGRGYLKAAEVPLSWVAGSPTLTAVEGELTGWFKPGEDWGFGIQNLTAQWNGQAIEPFSLHLRQRVGQHWGELDVAANYLDLAPLNDLLLSSGFFDNKAGQVLAALRPSGKVRNLAFDMDFSRDAPDFLVRANLDNLAVSSWSGAPAARGVSGYIEANLHRGFVVLDSPKDFAMHYPQAYDDFMPYGATQGKVVWHWLPEQKRVLVTSNHIAIRGEEGEGTAFLHLDLPTVKGGNPEMFLMVGMKNSHTRFVDRYLPKVLNPDLRAWLDRAIGDGTIEEAGFIWRGSLLKAFDAGRSIQVYGKLRDGTLDYQEGWPALSGAAATLVVDNREMDVWLDQGVLAGETVSGLGANLRQTPSGPLLRVVGDVETEADKGLAILAASPVRAQLSGLLALDIDGAVAVDLDLHIPLSKDKSGEDYRVDVKPLGAALTLPGTGFTIDNIQGDVRYDHRDGLRADSLTGTLWEQPVTGVIASDADHIRFTADGVLGATGLKALLGPYASHAKGETAVAAQLQVPRRGGGPSQLVLTSNLQGLALTLPEPFTKKAKAALDTRLELEIGDGRVAVRGGAADKLALSARFAEGELVQGTLGLLSDSVEPATAVGLTITGDLDRVDWGQWHPVLTPPADSDPTPSAPDNIHLDLRMNDLVVGGFSLGQTALRGAASGSGGWQLAVESNRLAGEVTIAGGAPPVLALDYLKLPKAPPVEGGDGDTQTETQKKPGMLDGISPLDIPEFDVAVKALYYGDEALGHIAFSSRRLGDGVIFDHIAGTLRNIQIKPQALGSDQDELDPAQLRWTVADGNHASFFSGTLEIANIETVIARWGKPAPFAAKEAAFFVNLGWADRPTDINTLALDGYLGIDFRDGQFYEASGGAADALFKLVGLINFDTWLRRLRFDFSDFFSEGMSFDRVQGGLLFRKGLVDFDDPVVASMPGGTVRLLGSADLIYEQLNARLVATMPVGTNLPWVAGLLGGLPAAAGVFLTSKLFEKQVDQLSSIGYRVTGAFDDPDIEVERIFTDPTKLSADDIAADEITTDDGAVEAESAEKPAQETKP